MLNSIASWQQIISIKIFFNSSFQCIVAMGQHLQSHTTSQMSKQLYLDQNLNRWLSNWIHYKWVIETGKIIGWEDNLLPQLIERLRLIVWFYHWILSIVCCFSSSISIQSCICCEVKIVQLSTVCRDCVAHMRNCKHIVPKPLIRYSQTRISLIKKKIKH